MIAKTKTQLMAYTAVLLALLIALQFATRSLGQIVTGSCVNLLLAFAALCIGPWSGLTIALISPFFAFLLGIGTPFIQIVPLIAVGNAVYVLLIAFLSKAFRFKFGKLAGVCIAAVCKFFVLWLLIVKIVLPIMGLPEQKLAALSASFSFPQLITALIGGLLALLISDRIMRHIDHA
mgnify:CR=1 FL=1